MCSGENRTGIHSPRPSLWEGVWVIDKPPGRTSHQVLQRIRSISRHRKMGHIGTLDPLATGVLPVCVGWATKLIPYISVYPKVYRAQMVLGRTTDTQDATGQVLQVSRNPIPSPEGIEKACRSFVGNQWQIPPVYSALKFQGQPLYRWARRGKPVVKPSREIKIESIRILAIGGEVVDFEVTCSSGTYIRTLCADIGEQLGCGAYLNALRRTRSGPFTLEQAVPWEILEEGDSAEGLETWKLPLDLILGGYPQVRVEEAWKQKIKQGCLIEPEKARYEWPAVQPGEPVCVIGPENHLLAIYHRPGNLKRELMPLRVLI
jgi:tRNA pseudouridine55 synthase